MFYTFFYRKVQGFIQLFAFHTGTQTPLGDIFFFLTKTKSDFWAGLGDSFVPQNYTRFIC